IFLLATQRRALLPTIYSRTVPIYFNPVPRDIIKQALNKDEAAISASHGRPGLLLKNIQLQTPSLSELLTASDPSARLRLWLQAQLPKEEIRFWLNGLALELRNYLVQNYQTLAAGGQAGRLAKLLRSLLESLAGVSGQNWPLIAENIIISI
ncbi:MAG: hypothetical protein Q8L21_03725, partial [Candidatus Komeilibacteria bacterium]|nr:hypothetical protein [Candidatus Komeilibacteria bacterium]